MICMAEKQKLPTKDVWEQRLLKDVIINEGSKWGEQVVFDIMPVDFLRLAESDISAATDELGLINALSNVKRSIDCQVELIICEHGLKTKSEKERWNFPKKIDFLRKTHIIAPRVLEKINKTRNKLEHEFKKPNRENVEDGLDIATLFIGYTKQLKRVPDEMHIGLGESSTQYTTVYFDKVNYRFEVKNDSANSFFIFENDKSFKRIRDLFYGIQPANWSLVSRNDFPNTRY